MAKKRPCAIDTIREKLTPEQDATLMEIVSRPNPHLTDIQAYLLELDYTVSGNACSTWYRRISEAGIKAKSHNEKLIQYQGVNAVGTLNQMLLDVMDDIATARDKVSIGDIDDKEYLKALPHLDRVAVQTIETIERLGNLKEKRDLELSGAMRVCSGLRATFKDTPFAEPLEDALKGIMLEIRDAQG